jgi:hypothetical protein
MSYIIAVDLTENQRCYRDSDERLTENVSNAKVFATFKAADVLERHSYTSYMRHATFE